MDLGNKRRLVVVADAGGGRVDRNLIGCRDIEPAGFGCHHRLPGDADAEPDGETVRPATPVVEARRLAHAGDARPEQA